MTPHEQIRQIVGPCLQRTGLDLVDKLIRERPGVVIDIGANLGGFIPHWIAAGATEVHAFEPVPWIFDQLEVNQGANPFVHLNQIGISDRGETVRGIQLCGTFTLADPKKARMDIALEDRGPFDMQTIKLDDYILDDRIGDISLIKLDVDGYEFHALRGMEQTLNHMRPPIMIELSYLPRVFGESCESMIQWIYAHGYRLCTMDGEVCEDPLLVMEAYPWRTSFDMVAVPIERIPGEWPRVR